MLNVKKRNRKFCLLQSVNSNEKLYSLDEKARFARVCAARGWTMPYQDTCRDTMDHSYTLEPTPDAPKPYVSIYLYAEIAFQVVFSGPKFWPGAPGGSIPSVPHVDVSSGNQNQNKKSQNRIFNKILFLNYAVMQPFYKRQAGYPGFARGRKLQTKILLLSKS